MTSETPVQTPAAAPRPPAVAPLAEGLRAETFPVVADADGKVSDPRVVAFTRGVGQGFYERWSSQEETDRWVGALTADGQRLTAVYVDPGFSGLEPWGETLERLGHGPEHPVGTFAEWDKTINAGGPDLLPARLISAVTVNPGFRRRGILAHLMTSRLAAAVDEDMPLAALTVSEGGIYGRFGYGAATREQRIQVNATPAGDGFALRTPPTGTVLTVDPTRLGETLEEVFAAQHVGTRGSVDRHEATRKFGTARWSPDDVSSWNRAARAVVHVREDGEVGGCAVFSFDGWDTDPPTLRVIDMIAVDAASRIELWRHLTSMDLIQRVVHRQAPVEDPLAQALVNPRAREVTGGQDVLWIRVLDVVRCLQAREWAADGQMRLRVEDRLGIIDGDYRVSVRAGLAQVEQLEPVRTGPGSVQEEAPALRVDAETLGTLLLGDVSLRTLHAAGRVTLESAGEADLRRLAASWDLPTAPHCATHF
ncbi:GNAT family N-acetyltransferase [Nesterenkonia xinjiangensis]|uniref:Putative acetyltransferase n=1 Tax=Nesterenkonia xinjiangensis TaxID=225327 RepID=A0A7Z0KA16_9MICC|nr:putative acetyltransferase [Nesterenkonia xinjiangensis]